LIGIYSIENLLKTRGQAILDTWYNSVDKKKAEIVFFANATLENMKIVKLPGVRYRFQLSFKDPPTIGKLPIFGFVLFLGN